MKAAVSALLFLMAVGVRLDEASSTASPVQPYASFAPRTSWEGLAIVVNRKNPIDNVTLEQLRDIFLEEREWWSNRRRIRLVAMQRGAAERQTVLRVIYRMKKDWDFDKYFFFGVYRGEFSTSPVTLATPEEVRNYVSMTPGAVGYLRASDVDNSVKVVSVNGLLPRDDGYPLRLRARPAM
jgi:phosphate transport system substrate-binding protein